jgi:hypothetical protein
MFAPFHSTMFLAFESGNVVGLRMMKIMSGGSGLHDEANLMVMRFLRQPRGTLKIALASTASLRVATSGCAKARRNSCCNPVIPERTASRSWASGEDRLRSGGASRTHAFVARTSVSCVAVLLHQLRTVGAPRAACPHPV